MVTAPADDRVFVIAEAGVNHDGSLEKGLALVDIAAAAGADAVKFQTFRTDEVVTRDAAKAAYQERETGAGSQYDMIRALELDDDAHRALAARCAERGIEFMSTPFAPWAVGFLAGLGMKRVKVASGEIVNRPLLRSVVASRLPIILSTGMATLAEVERAISWIREFRAETGQPEAAGDLVVLHCTSDYPAAAETVNLRAMDTLGAALGLPVGYSDHTLGQAVALAAVARGARVIEKHFTIDPTAPGPDHAASLDPTQLAEMVRGIRSLEVALGDGIKRPAPNELPTRELVRRSAFASRAIAPEEPLNEDNVAFLRPAGGIGPEDADRLFAARAARAISAGARIEADDLG